LSRSSFLYWLTLYYILWLFHRSNTIQSRGWKCLLFDYLLSTFPFLIAFWFLGLTRKYRNYLGQGIYQVVVQYMTFTSTPTCAALPRMRSVTVSPLRQRTNLRWHGFGSVVFWCDTESRDLRLVPVSWETLFYLTSDIIYVKTSQKRI